MQNILQEPIEDYLNEKSNNFGGNSLADKFRNQFPQQIEKIIIDKIRFKVIGSPGKGNWTECPWIAILDTLITETPQKGYYPVLLFRSDMTGVYLSLNQGVTDVIENYKREAKSVLKLRAEDFRAKLDIGKTNLVEKIQLHSSTKNAKHYEAGNIIAKFYSSDNLPNNEELRSDILKFLNYYENLTYSDTSFSEEPEYGFEKKQIRLHKRIERNSNISKKVKKIKGYQCEACSMNFRDKYGELGDKYIEAHHLIPISTLGIGKFRVDYKNDFAILCSNCHSMIHRLKDPSDLEQLKKIVLKNFT
ncbi:MrcB family domain-containing protein [Zunongwangia atlantica]|uniref:Putative restriction endonuclease n=1 Tax=Zunongwangia atlantica 22II14-10F7 TaxID=1185767 RepID=A0A1Y1SYQ9_9FLAO|nr:DUF3578 domain-containing protein [Zunongwangia atlantica]ORL43534.1 putative restriction endonuclease [Zunongwangia atlantica 22II14-10F7]